MKNKKLIIIIIFIIMLIPARILLKDGGSVKYKAVLYSVTRIHALNDNSSTGYEDGLEVKVLGITVYNVRNVYVNTSKIELVKPDYSEYFEFESYLDMDNKKIYLTDNIKEIYYYNGDYKYKLRNYIMNMVGNFDEGINELISLTNLYSTLKDGGTKIYKSHDYDITVIVCNTLIGNKDVFIGDYGLEYNSFTMCKR